MQDREKSKTTGTDPALSEESVQETARSLSNFGEAMRGSAKTELFSPLLDVTVELRKALSRLEEAYDDPARGSTNLAEVIVDPFSAEEPLVGEVVEPVDRLPIELVGGDTVWVSPEDHDRVGGYRWSVGLNGRKGVGNKLYAYRHEYRDDRTREKIYLHRVILDLKPGDGKTVDHINGDTLNCTRRNLRVATGGQNSMNRPKQGGYRGRTTSSRFKGVCWSRRDQRWIARVWAEGRLHFLGSFRDEYDAAKAYDARARELHGEFARLNSEDRPELLTDLSGRRA